MVMKTHTECVHVCNMCRFHNTFRPRNKTQSFPHGLDGGVFTQPSWITAIDLLGKVHLSITKTKTKNRSAHFFLVGSRVLFKGWYHVLQKLSGRSVNPGLQMFGQSISGNVDMDGNGYTGMVITELFSNTRTSKQNEKHKVKKDDIFKYLSWLYPVIVTQ